MPVRGAAILWPATSLTPSLSSEHLSNAVYHRLDSSTFLFSCHVTQTCKNLLVAPCQLSTLRVTLVDFSCVPTIRLICYLGVCFFFMLLHIQGSTSSLWLRAKTSVKSPGTVSCLSVRTRRSRANAHRIAAFHVLRADGGTSMGSEMDSTRLLITSCPCSHFAVPFLRPVIISTTKSSDHDPRNSSCYVSTVWSMLLWDISLSH